MEILKIFTECIIWEVKKWFLECVRDVWLLKYVLGGAHLPIPYRTQFNFLNIMPSAPVLPPYSSFCSHFLPIASLYYVFPPRMFQAISAWIVAAFLHSSSLPCCLLPFPISLLSIPSSHRLLTPPSPSQGLHTPFSRRDCCSHSQSGESWCSSALRSNSISSERVCPPLSSIKRN